MNIDLSTLSAQQAYHLMTQTVVPRPIAWVLTKNTNDAGDYNLAPFSFFNAISSNPPLLMFSVGQKAVGGDKDTYRNIMAHKEMVIHIASADEMNTVESTAIELDYGNSEVSAAGLETCAFDFPFSLPRLANSSIAFACELYQVNSIGETPQAIILAEIKHIYINDKAVNHSENNRYTVDAKIINPLCRLGAKTYAKLGDVIRAD